MTADEAARRPLIPNDQMMFTAPEVAAILGVSSATVRRLAQRGELPMEKIGGQWFMTRDSLLKILGWPWDGPPSGGWR